MTIELLAPAKINLGLEVIGKRRDGFHDIATVFQTISVFDRVRMQTNDIDEVLIVNRDVQFDANLAERAVQQSRLAGVTSNCWRVEIDKRIPVAAGLGGASSDAAAVLVGLASRANISTGSIATCALALGSDVPFLLTGGAALAFGRGEKLSGLPSLRQGWMVLASPILEMEHKTARLYGALLPADLSSGARAASVSEALQAGSQPDAADLANAFERPLYQLLPVLTGVQAAFMEAGAAFVSLSGAGPTHYTLTRSLGDAISMSLRLRQTLPLPAKVLIARPIASSPILRGGKTRTGS